MDDDLFEVVLEPRRPEPRRVDNDFAVIDLTADPDSPPTRAPQRPHNNHNNNHNHNHTANLRPGRSPPAQAGNAAAGNHDPNAVIDLTGDEPSPEPRRAQPPLPHPQPQLPRVSLEPDDLDDIIILRSLRHQRTAHSRRPPQHDRRGLSSRFLPSITSYLGMHLFPGLDLNYQRSAFDPPPPPPPQDQQQAAAQHLGVGNKMEVPATKEGFTRDTGEETVVVCPACDNDLEYDPVKSEGKKRKRDKGEHHFWAVKRCGHVRLVPLLPCFVLPFILVLFLVMPLLQALFCNATLVSCPRGKPGKCDADECDRCTAENASTAGGRRPRTSPSSAGRTARPTPRRRPRR